ncbi:MULTISPECIES: hypothetical protein [Wolbachia]|uniref:hypothetical protein n=1 Tax=Wolbachia TaxID=953 RepID=UPI001651651D|nr:hypothetical protein [Wolbachia pipientis]MBC6686713.1 hypothetical protein [Wolbachia pipientis]
MITLYESAIATAESTNKAAGNLYLKLLLELKWSIRSYSEDSRCKHVTVARVPVKKKGRLGLLSISNIIPNN